MGNVNKILSNLRRGNFFFELSPYPFNFDILKNKVFIPSTGIYGKVGRCKIRKG